MNRIENPTPLLFDRTKDTALNELHGSQGVFFFDFCKRLISFET